jgi:hypothetical protein
VLNTSGTAGAIAYARPVVAGNLLIAAVRIGNAAGVASITDNNGNNWQVIDRRSDTGGGNGDDLELWYALNASTTPNNQPTLTIRSSVSATIRAVIAEYSGVSTSAALDQHAIAIGTSASPNVVTSGATAKADELVIGYGEVENQSAFAVGNGYAMDNSVPAGAGGKLALEHTVAPTAGVLSAGFGVSSQAWGMGIATFR